MSSLMTPFSSTYEARHQGSAGSAAMYDKLLLIRSAPGFLVPPLKGSELTTRRCSHA